MSNRRLGNGVGFAPYHHQPASRQKGSQSPPNRIWPPGPRTQAERHPTCPGLHDKPNPFTPFSSRTLKPKPTLIREVKHLNALSNPFLTRICLQCLIRLRSTQHQGLLK